MAAVGIRQLEARAAVVRRRHDSAMSGASFGRVVHHLDSDWERYLVVDISDAVIREGARLAEAHRLRAYDAVHLASATTVQGRVADRCLFASWDSKLERAVLRDGIEPLRPGGD